MDARGEPGETTLTVELEPREAVNLDVIAMERDDPDAFDGRLGDGAGKWRLTVSAPKSLHVMNLVHSPATRHVSNVSR